MAVDGGRADDHGGLASEALGEQVLQGSAHGDHLLYRGLEALCPQATHELLGGVAGVVGDEGDPLARPTQRQDGLGRPRGGAFTNPYAAVEVEQHVLIGGEERGQGHRHTIILSGVRRLDCPPVLVALVGAGLLAGCGSSSSGGSTITVGNEKGASSPAASTPASTPTTPTTPAPAGCKAVSAPAPKGAQHLSKPTAKLDPKKVYTVRLLTNCGEIDLALDVKRAPRTSVSFAYLVGRGFYDGLSFHRVAAGFVIQGGDPNGDGSGGPGYQVVEKPPAHISYTPGTVAMAKTGSDPDGTSGSQFFIITGTQSSLPPQYALLGHVTGGQAAVSAIAQIPTNPPQDGMPTSPVVITKATLSVR